MLPLLAWRWGRAPRCSTSADHLTQERGFAGKATLAVARPPGRHPLRHFRPSFGPSVGLQHADHIHDLAPLRGPRPHFDPATVDLLDGHEFADIPARGNGEFHGVPFARILPRRPRKSRRRGFLSTNRLANIALALNAVRGSGVRSWSHRLDGKIIIHVRIDRPIFHGFHFQARAFAIRQLGPHDVDFYPAGT